MLTFLIYGGAGLLIGIITMCIYSYILAQRAARRRALARRVSGDTPPPKKKREASKMLAAWAAITASLTIVASVTLAAFDKQALNDLSIAVFTACIGYLVTYAGKSAFEKNSRNKHGLDENGFPYEEHNDH